jgi:hypothetical protein
MIASPLPSFVQAYDTSRPTPAFSNGFEGDCWQSAWCESCQHQDDCALLDVAHLGRTPAEWIELDRYALNNRYFCKSWIAAVDHAFLPADRGDAS